MDILKSSKNKKATDRERFVAYFLIWMEIAGDSTHRRLGEILLAIRVLCAGDIHIGRRSSKVQGVFRSADAWRDIVDTAIKQDVDVVALSGDIIDKESKSYEALGPMQHGLVRLGEAGIETVAVAGNHDHDVLVRLASITGTQRFHLLGKVGQWERFTFRKDGTPLLHIDGWSFPSEHVTHPPLGSHVPLPGNGVPIMGLLHGDLNVNSSSYAPINLHELWAKPFNFTLLGHIHLPEIFTGPEGKQALYPGSPYALDPGEPGIHGCWIAEFERGNNVSLQKIPLSPVHYASVDMNLDGAEDETEFQGRLSETLTAIADKASQDYGSDTLQVVSARIRGVGVSSAHRMMDRWIGQALLGLGQFQVGSIYVEVDTFTSSVQPPIDLHERAKGTDPVAEAAKIILALKDESPSSPYSDLIDNTFREMLSIYGHSGYAALRSTDDHTSEIQIDDAKQVIRVRTWEMLSMLVSQEEEV